jgi:molecular chaperone DnaJ
LANTSCPHCNGTGKTHDHHCPKCHGVGTLERTNTEWVWVPAGAKNGQKLVVTGAGKRKRTSILNTTWLKWSL